MSALDLSIVIPALDEEATIGDVVEHHARVATELGIGFEIVACDDGSGDGTRGVLEGRARRLPLRVIRHDRPAGIPATMTELYAAAAGEWVYFTPGDGQVPAEALRVMWPRRAGLSALVGRRHPRRDAFTRIAQARAYSLLVRAVFGIRVRDIDGVKLYRAADLRRARPSSTSVFFEAERLVRLTRDGLAVSEVDVPHLPRRAGRAKGVSLRTTAAALRDLAAFASRRQAPVIVGERPGDTNS